MGKCLTAALFLFWTVSATFAMDGCGAGPCANCHSLTLKEANELLRDVGQVKKVQLSPVNGLWLLDLEKDGRQGVVFMDFGKKNLIAGTMFPLGAKKANPEQMKQPTAGSVPKSTLSAGAIPVENSIVMGNPAGKKRLFVFTDPECPFCKKMHGELKTLAALESDLVIYVKMFPLRMHPGSYDKARVVLGARSGVMLDTAFAGLPLPAPGPRDAREPVDETMKLAASLGIDSTPTLVLPDGRVMAGFKDAAALKGLLTESN